MVFPVVRYGCESWTVKKAEHQRIDAIKLQCWRRLLWIPWTARRSNQSFLMEISPEYSLKGLMLKLKLQYQDARDDSLEKALMLGKIESKNVGGGINWNGWIALLTQWTWVWVNSRSWWWTGMPGMLQSMGLQRVGHDWVTELNWTGWFCFFKFLPGKDGIFVGEITWCLGFDLISSRGKKINSLWGNMLISSCCYSDPFSTLQCSGPYPESWSWRDCLNKSKLTPGFQLLSNKGL